MYCLEIELKSGCCFFKEKVTSELKFLFREMEKMQNRKTALLATFRKTKNPFSWVSSYATQSLLVSRSCVLLPSAEIIGCSLTSWISLVLAAASVLLFHFSVHCQLIIRSWLNACEQLPICEASHGLTLLLSSHHMLESVPGSQ